MSGRGRRVLVYTATLLVAPMPAMPFVKGTREFVVSLVAVGAILSAGSFYVARGELRCGRRDLLGYKLIASSVITLLFGASVLVGAAVYLSRG